jgi:hypothetical protein
MTENCPYKNKCSGVDCDKDFCMRKYRLDCLYDKSLLTDKQRQVGKLFTDEDGTDLHEFQQLAQIEQNIERFVDIELLNDGTKTPEEMAHMIKSLYDKHLKEK